MNNYRRKVAKKLSSGKKYQLKRYSGLFYQECTGFIRQLEFLKVLKMVGKKNDFQNR